MSSYSKSTTTNIVINVVKSFLFILGVGTFQIVVAGERAGSETSFSKDEWKFHVSPYLWGASMSGDVGHSRIGTHYVESRFSDILKNVDFSAMIMGEARKGKMSIFLDYMYINGSMSHGLPPQVPAQEIKAKGNVTTGYLGAGYTVFEGENTRVDLIGGLRVWHADLTLGLHGGPMPVTTAGVSETWIDATAGVRGRYFLNDQFSLTAWALAGKGGAKKDWDLALLANWSINKSFTLTAGYRAMGVDYEKNKVVYDIRQQGPMVGLTYSF